MQISKPFVYEGYYNDNDTTNYDPNDTNAKPSTKCKSVSQVNSPSSKAKSTPSAKLNCTLTDSSSLLADFPIEFLDLFYNGEPKKGQKYTDPTYTDNMNYGYKMVIKKQSAKSTKSAIPETPPIKVLTRRLRSDFVKLYYPEIYYCGNNNYNKYLAKMKLRTRDEKLGDIASGISDNLPEEFTRLATYYGKKSLDRILIFSSFQRNNVLVFTLLYNMMVVVFSKFIECDSESSSLLEEFKTGIVQFCKSIFLEDSRVKLLSESSSNLTSKIEELEKLYSTFSSRFQAKGRKQQVQCIISTFKTKLKQRRTFLQYLASFFKTGDDIHLRAYFQQDPTGPKTIDGLLLFLSTKGITEDHKTMAKQSMQTCSTTTNKAVVTN
jgi:hypothetical protein